MGRSRLPIVLALFSAACANVVGIPERSLDEEGGDGGAIDATVEPAADGARGEGGAVVTGGGEGAAGDAEASTADDDATADAGGPADAALDSAADGGADATPDSDADAGAA